MASRIKRSSKKRIKKIERRREHKGGRGSTWNEWKGKKRKKGKTRSRCAVHQQRQLFNVFVEFVDEESEADREISCFELRKTEQDEMETRDGRRVEEKKNWMGQEDAKEKKRRGRGAERQRQKRQKGQARRGCPSLEFGPDQVQEAGGLANATLCYVETLSSVRRRHIRIGCGEGKVKTEKKNKIK